MPPLPERPPRRFRFSRRDVLALGFLTSAALWTSFSSQFAARFLRARLAEIGRGVTPPRHQPEPQSWPTNALHACWIGHATVLLKFYGVTILTDPSFFARIGADLGVGTLGPKRLIGPGVRVHELPPIDLILLSHAHMDHIDLPSLSRFTAEPQVVTARATSDLLEATRLRRVTELGWGESTRVRTGQGDLQVTAFEVKHWGARWRRDRYRGYNGYLLEREGRSIIFGGDTALTRSFRQLRRKREHDLAIMPIGAYDPWHASHCTPEEAVQMVNEAHVRYLLPVHHSTYVLSREPVPEPMARLEAALEKERLALREVGETFRS